MARTAFSDDCCQIKRDCLALGQDPAYTARACSLHSHWVSVKPAAADYGGESPPGLAQCYCSDPML